MATIGVPKVKAAVPGHGSRSPKRRRLSKVVREIVGIVTPHEESNCQGTIQKGKAASQYAFIICCLFWKYWLA